MSSCQFCDRSPAGEIVVRRHVGMLVMQRFYKARLNVCRSCGWKILGSWTGRTLIQGWWGYISFFVNCFNVVMNVVAAIKVTRIPKPHFSSTFEEA